MINGFLKRSDDNQ
jgi:hypothetical protein